MVASLGAVGAAGSAHAIANDWVSDTEHPYVGLAVVYDANGEFVHRCSGSLIDARIFFTAATAPMQRAVW